MSPEIDWARVVAVWAAGGRTPATIGVYLYWARRFVAHCRALRRDPIAELTLTAARRVMMLDPPRRTGGTFGHTPLIAARALGCALAALGFSVPKWTGERPVRRRPALIERFLEHRSRYRGIVERTRQLDGRYAPAFIKFLVSRRRTVRTMRIVDIDAFVISCAKTLRAKTVAGICSALRSFLRYLHMVGASKVNLALHVASPRVRAIEAPLEPYRGAPFVESSARSTPRPPLACATRRSSS